MKQIRECIDRALRGDRPLRKKWRGQVLRVKDYPFPVLVLMHYQHLVLLYCVERSKVLYSWHELPTDKRGHDAAIDYLDELSKDGLEYQDPLTK